MEWAQVLVIILSIFLGFFLILAIVLMVLLIKVTRQIKSITTTAEKAALNAESFVSGLSRFSSPMIIAKLVSSYLKKAKKK